MRSQYLIQIALALIWTLILGATFANAQTDGKSKRILSLETKPVYVAEEALKENIQKKDVKSICLSLKHPRLHIKQIAAEALGKIGDKTAVTCLLDAFKEHQNYVPLASNSELDAAINEFDDVLLNSISKLTGLQFVYKSQEGKRLKASEATPIIRDIERWHKLQIPKRA